MKISTTLSLVASSLALLGSVSAAVDPCTLVSQWPNRTKVDGGWEQSKACLENFPFNNAVAQQTLDTVIDTLDAFFVFKDIAARPPKSQLSIKNVDLIKELKALKNKKYNSDFAFQTDIQNIASSLYDAHLSYSPLCYTRNWDWKQALLLYAPVLNGKQSIKVFDILENYIPSVTADLIDCEVVEIDDKPAFKVIVDFAKEKGGQFKDLNVRFNAAMMSNHFYVNGTFKKYYGTWQNPGQLPTKPLTKYKLQCPNKKAQTLTLPWVVTAPGGNYNDSASYYAQECAVAAPVPMMPSEMGQFHEVPSTHTQDPRSLLVKAGHAHVPHRFDIASNFTLITSDDMFLFGYISKGKGVLYKTGIINIGTFLPADVGHSVQTFHQGLKEFKKLGIEKIILDVQNNFGGYVCLTQIMLHILFNHINNNSTTPDLEYATDILVTGQSLALEANEESPFSATSYETVDGKPLTGDLWLKNSIKYMRGGKTSRYSQRVRTNCTSFISQYYFKDLGVLPWKSKDYLILSNGICGSSCALFTNRMHQLKNVKTIAIGGILHNPMTYQSFPGLQVLKYDTDFLTWINSTEYGNLYQKYPALFKNIIPFPQKTELSFTFREGFFPDKSNTPLEYQFIPADERIDFDPQTARNIHSLWFKVAGYFK